MKRYLAIIATPLALLAQPASAQDFAITNATVATGDGSAPVENATVLVRGGKVAAVGQGIAVPEAGSHLAWLPQSLISDCSTSTMCRPAMM